MNHIDHVHLLKPADLPLGGTWADLGAGTGAFTLALRELIGPEANVYAVDKDRASLTALRRTYHRRFGDEAMLHVVGADFARDLDLPPLDGLLMANSLHFHRERERVLRHVRIFLKPRGKLLLVEYNVDTGNLWVPHPLSFGTFQSMAVKSGFAQPRLLAQHPSSFLHEFYSAITIRAET